MASLTLTVGTITSTKNANNTTVAALIADYVAAYGGPVNGTNQEKADWFLDRMVKHIREASNGQSVKAARDAAEVTAVQTVSTRDWV